MQGNNVVIDYANELLSNSFHEMVWGVHRLCPY